MGELIQRNENTHEQTIVEDTPEMIAKIARFNEYLTPGEVDAALAEGKRVYTSFSSYIRTFTADERISRVSF